MKNLKGIISYFLMLPAIFIGTFAMESYGVTSSIWIQNIVIWILGTILGFVFILETRGEKYHYR